MTLGKMGLVCVCFVGLTQLLWSQNPVIGENHEKGIPGHLDPRTGMFTARVQHPVANEAGGPPLSGTSVLFREQFNFTISNLDYAPSLVVCEAYIYENGDANGEFYDDAVIFATKNGNTYTCNVPVLTQWILQTPTTDTIYAYTYVYFEQGVTIGSAPAYLQVRESEQPSMQLSVPSNGSTVVNTISVTM